MPRMPIAPPRWNTVAAFGLCSVLGACGDNGTGPPDDDAAAFLFESLTVRSSHTCGLTPEGKAYCWGWNGYGQLGDGSITNRSTPVAVTGDLTFSALEAGGAHTCGITTDGATYCWGLTTSDNSVTEPR